VNALPTIAFVFKFTLLTLLFCALTHIYLWYKLHFSLARIITCSLAFLIATAIAMDLRDLLLGIDVVGNVAEEVSESDDASNRDGDYEVDGNTMHALDPENQHPAEKMQFSCVHDLAPPTNCKKSNDLSG
jgi:hypothetical protein